MVYQAWVGGPAQAPFKGYSIAKLVAQPPIAPLKITLHRVG